MFGIRISCLTKYVSMHTSLGGWWQLASKGSQNSGCLESCTRRYEMPLAILQSPAARQARDIQCQI